ncbi:hypothetical protein [Clostridium sp. C8-1-8]|uniref:hypothetical protein n=1 Tax=Clostridium sp. C8-1-8 TaxID=2698831 RepID=UPI0013710AFA|nr:hypothetical protein [Clostridium sp. C8-1-8]
MAKKTYTKSDLSEVASQAKREIINKIKKGTLQSITKSNALDLIARKLKLKSARTLWYGDSREYLDEWFSKLNNQIDDILKLNTPQQPSPSPLFQNQDKELSDFEMIIRDKSMLIIEYEKANRILREENEKLRLLVLEKHGKIDL